jgi:hypothetical protein
MRVGDGVSSYLSHSFICFLCLTCHKAKTPPQHTHLDYNLGSEPLSIFSVQSLPSTLYSQLHCPLPGAPGTVQVPRETQKGRVLPWSPTV